MCVVINQFLFPSNLCDMPRFHCATCSGLPVRHAPVLLCDLLRIMHIFPGMGPFLCLGVHGRYSFEKYFGLYFLR